jgi:hypothetical protein
MGQGVSRRALTAEARIRSRVSPCGIFDGRTDTGTGFSPSISVFPPVSLIPPVLHCTEKQKKLINLITWLHIKPQGCSGSVASAAGPFTTQKKGFLSEAQKSLCLYNLLFGSNDVRFQLRPPLLILTLPEELRLHSTLVVIALWI